MIRDQYINDRFGEIDQAVTKAAAWAAGDPELGAVLAAYLATLVSGVYEDCMEYLVGQRVRKSGDPELANYVETVTARRFRNPNTENIVGVLAQFGTGYKDEFKRRVRADSTTALDSIVEDKNLLAHGNGSQLQVTIGELEDYFKRSSEVFEVLEDLLV